MKSLWFRAALAGIAAGIAMLALLVLGATASGFDWDAPLRWIAAVLMSEPALIVAGQARGGMSGPALIVLALVIHLIVASALAGAFLMLTNGVAGWPVAAFAIVYGLAIWALMTFAVLPMFDSVMAARVQLVWTHFLIAHVVYGAILAVIAIRRSDPLLS